MQKQITILSILIIAPLCSYADGRTREESPTPEAAFREAMNAESSPDFEALVAQSADAGDIIPLRGGRVVCRVYRGWECVAITGDRYPVCVLCSRR